MNKPVYIVGGGSSLKSFNFSHLNDKTTIAINQAIFHIENCDYFITEDYSFIHRLKKREKIQMLNDIKATKIFVAQLGLSYLKYMNGKLIDTRTNLVYYLEPFDMIIHCDKTGGIGLTFDDFRDGNFSGFAALQFAVIMGFNPIYLLGFDFTFQNKTHFHEGYFHRDYENFAREFKKKLHTYYNFFKDGLKELQAKRPDIKIYNCSKISKLNEILEYRRLPEA